MEAYTGFADVYDDFMDNVPYEEWCDYICHILSMHGINDGLILDLGWNRQDDKTASRPRL